ncbi:hypothetical protein BN165_1040050 [Clostridioides difficile E1]|nr:hypothetical protein BN163_1130051 [Clostridioides difficile T5]CCK94181.1 hypothetical protein BN165_1040050 [Clostridioides difficile E1]
MQGKSRLAGGNQCEPSFFRPLQPEPESGQGADPDSCHDRGQEPEGEGVCKRKILCSPLNIRGV